MRAAVLSTVCASVSFFAPGADLRPAVQPAAVLQPAAVQLSVPQVNGIPSSRTAGNDDASARWFAYGLFGALFTMAVRSAARADSRPASRSHALRMSATDPSSTAVAEQAVFTETQISNAMRQVTPVWKKNENGYWEDTQTAEEKREQALKLLREAVAKPVVSRRPRASGLTATKGFTGDEFAFVYRSKAANRTSTPVEMDPRSRLMPSRWTGDTTAAEMDPSSRLMPSRWTGEKRAASKSAGVLAFTEEQRSAGADEAVFTETQISNAMRQVTPVWNRNENGYWEADTSAEAEEEKRARAEKLLRETLAKPVYERRPRARGLTATKGFTGDEYAFVYRSKAVSSFGAPGPDLATPQFFTRSVKRDSLTDGRTPLDWVAPKSAAAGVVRPTNSPEPTDSPKPEPEKAGVP